MPVNLMQVRNVSCRNLLVLCSDALPIVACRMTTNLRAILLAQCSPAVRSSFKMWTSSRRRSLELQTSEHLLRLQASMIRTYRTACNCDVCTYICLDIS